MARKREEKPLTVHGYIPGASGEWIRFTGWPRLARSVVLARVLEDYIPAMNPGYKAVLDPICYELDLKQYITPDCILHLPWMDK